MNNVKLTISLDRLKPAPDCCGFQGTASSYIIPECDGSCGNIDHAYKQSFQFASSIPAPIRTCSRRRVKFNPFFLSLLPSGTWSTVAVAYQQRYKVISRH
ncbi:hypothetical protein JTE90_026512 [Oedothorax gibbosus]|uniref:Uncharacterized protein n=1 Tax=Oedothorax gibbosus TaxID=931172 RepID=A0AAV6VPQ7_9ARAC|nr:hypothetical protein JTE90_026512 [Oedothorax gibbosus]